MHTGSRETFQKCLLHNIAWSSRLGHGSAHGGDTLRPAASQSLSPHWACSCTQTGTETPLKALGSGRFSLSPCPAGGRSLRSFCWEGKHLPGEAGAGSGPSSAPSHISLPSAPALAGSTQPYRGSLCCNSIPACPDTIFMAGAHQPTELQERSPSSCAVPAGEAGAQTHTGTESPRTWIYCPQSPLGQRDPSWAAHLRQSQYQAPAAKL